MTEENFNHAPPDEPAIEGETSRSAQDVAIKKLGSENVDQFENLVRVFEDAFGMEKFVMPGQNHLRRVLGRDDFIVFAASLGDQVIGGLTAYVLEQYYCESPLVYIYDLAVRAEFRRRGVGKKLIAGVTDYCRQTGAEGVFVQADGGDDEAVKFYRSTGAAAAEAVHFYYALKAE